MESSRDNNTADVADTVDLKKTDYDIQILDYKAGYARGLYGENCIIAWHKVVQKELHVPSLSQTSGKTGDEQ